MATTTDKRTSFNAFWDEIVQDAQREGPAAVEELAEFEVAFSLARQLVFARKQRHLSQTQVAKRTGIDQGEVSKLESGRANSTMRTVERILRTYDMGLLAVPRSAIPRLNAYLEKHDLRRPVTQTEKRSAVRSRARKGT